MAKKIGEDVIEKELARFIFLPQRKARMDRFRLAEMQIADNGRVTGFVKVLRAQTGSLFLPNTPTRMMEIS
jgi:hypothetical protein